MLISAATKFGTIYLVSSLPGRLDCRRTGPGLDLILVGARDMRQFTSTPMYPTRRHPLKNMLQVRIVYMQPLASVQGDLHFHFRQ